MTLAVFLKLRNKAHIPSRNTKNLSQRLAGMEHDYPAQHHYKARVHLNQEGIPSYGKASDTHLQWSGDAPLSHGESPIDVPEPR